MTQQQVTTKREFGMQTLLSLLLIVSAGLGLWVLDTQVEVFSFGDSTYDAQFFPRIILSLIVVTVFCRLILRRREKPVPIGAISSWLRIFVVTFAIIAALLLMPTIGFLAGSFLAAFVTAVAFGERKLLYNVGLPLLVAALVTFGAQKGLNIPLP